MVVTVINDKVMLVDKNLARVANGDKVEVYASEQLAIQGKAPSKTYVANEAKGYLSIILDKLNLNGSDKAISKLLEIAKA